jgi:hypothetical protein
MSNCLIGIGEGTDSSNLTLTSPCIIVSKSHLAENLNDNLSPKIQQWLTYGYNAVPSSEDITLKASIASAQPGKQLANLSDRISYAAYKEWALNVKNSTGTELAGVAAVNSSSQSWMAYAIDSPTLLAHKVSPSDAKIESFTRNSNTDEFTFILSIKNTTIGDNALVDNLAKVFKLEGANSLNDKMFSQDNVDIVFGKPKDGKIQVKIRPKNPSKTSYFFKAGLVTE